MDGLSFRKALTSLNLPLYKAAEFLGVSDATVRNWANDRARIPQPVAMLLRLMLALKLDAAKVDEWLGGSR